MEFFPSKETDELDGTGTQLSIKLEPHGEFLDDSVFEPDPFVMTCDDSTDSIKSESLSDEEIIERHCKKKRKICQTNELSDKNELGNGRKENGEKVVFLLCHSRSNYSHPEREGGPELTQLPYIVNIKSSAVNGRPSQENHNDMIDTSSGIHNTSLQSSISERTCEMNGNVALNKVDGQKGLDNNFSSEVFKMLVDIQSTLKDLKAEVTENSKKIDQLQKSLPLSGSWYHHHSNAKNDFNFPITTEEQLLEFENRLQNKEEALKLVANLTSRTYKSWKEMILICLKYMLSGNVALLYNLNGIKGSKKKFRDLIICKILVECVQYIYKEAPTSEILKRISLVLASAGDWHGLRKHRRCKKD